MPSSYTTSLRLTLPATGELSGQWGNTVNTGITELLDAAVAGTASISTWGGAGVAYTLSNNSGTADEARKMFIVATGTPGEAKNVICPAVSKFYVFRNDTTGGFALTLKTPSGTGIAVPAGQYKFLYCDGTNVVEMFNSVGSLTLGTALAASSGGTGQSTYTAGDLIYATGATTLAKLGIGASTTILTSSGTAPQWTTASSVSIGTATNLAGGLAGSVPYQSGAATTTFLSIGAANTVMTSSGTAPQWSTALTGLTGVSTTTLSASSTVSGTGFSTYLASPPAIGSTAANTGAFTTLSASGNVTLSGGTANGVLYLNGSKVATSGSAITFDGTNFATTGSATATALIPSGSSVPTNGMYLPAANTVAWSTNTTERARITSSGDLLINTTSAVSGSKLVVASADATIYGITVGRGGGGSSQNVAVGNLALLNNSGGSNTAIGDRALTANTTGTQNTAVGFIALTSNTIGIRNTAVGRQALTTNIDGNENTAFGFRSLYSNTSGGYNTAVGGFDGVRGPLNDNSTGSYNVALGSGALGYNTTASNNTAVGYQALYTSTVALANVAVGYQAGYTSNATAAPSNVGANTFLGAYAGFSATSAINSTIVGGAAGYNLNTGSSNTLVGRIAGYNLTSGTFNTFVGPGDSNGGSGYLVSTGSKNTILGAYSGNQDSLDIRTASNRVVISDGDGNRQLSMYEGGTVALDNAVPAAGTGITFPATQSASTDANTLDDYEEGTWTPTGTGITLSSATGYYTKIGRLVAVQYDITFPSTSNTGTADIGGLPFTVSQNNSANSSGAGSIHYYNGSINPLQMYLGGQTTGFRFISFAANKTNADMSGVRVMGQVIYYV